MGIQIFLRGRTRPGAYPDKRRGRAEAGRGVPGQAVWPGEAVVRLPALPPPLLLAVPLTRSPLRPPFLQ